MDSLIAMRATGTPEEFAYKMKLSLALILAILLAISGITDTIHFIVKEIYQTLRQLKAFPSFRTVDF